MVWALVDDAETWVYGQFARRTVGLNVLRPSDMSIDL